MELFDGRFFQSIVRWWRRIDNRPSDSLGQAAHALDDIGNPNEGEDVMSKKKLLKKRNPNGCDSGPADRHVEDAISLLIDCICCLESGNTADLKHHVKSLRELSK